MTTEEAKLFRDRWAAVEAVKAEERKAFTFESRLHDLGKLYNFAKQMGWLERMPQGSEDPEILERWNRLRRRAGV